MLQIPSFREACDILGVRVDEDELVGLRGAGLYTVHRPGEGLVDIGVFRNLITDVGDEYYAERAAGIASPPGQVTGMRLGTGTTAPSKTGAGAAIVTWAGAGITANKAIDGGFPTSAQPGGAGTARQIQWRTTWNAGQATAVGLAEVVITIESPLTDVAGTAANTVSRALLSPVINKAAGDVLTVTWNHLLLGA